MPGFDRTGPMGAGPMTGGRRGSCNPATAGTMPVYGGGYGYGHGLGLRRGFRGGYGSGMGRGYGRGYGWEPIAAGPIYPMGIPSEVDILKEQAGHLKNSLDSINRWIEAMEKQSSEQQ